MPVIRRHLIAAALVAAASLPALTASPSVAADKVTVGSKIDTEGALLGNMVVLLLRNKGLDVVSKVQLGNTKIVRTALIAGEIDVYPEYTGNAGFFFSMDSDPLWKDPQKAYEKARDLDLEKNKLVWLKPAPADNTWAIAVRKDVAQANKLKTLEDLAAWTKGGGKVKVAGSAEFVESAAALPAFQKAYGFDLKSDQLLVFSGGDTAATEKAAADGTSGVNAAMAYGTDGAIAALNLVVLTDPKNVQPVYQPAAVVRQEVLARSPVIKEALEPAFATLTLETLQALNAKIAVDGQDAGQVAKAYLTEKGLLK
ncbi:osmoprotectant transport system substrate-binding protein [Rhizobiales bacterium GAS188]|nr:osmoprotectant transport system substrate-binding protein [Rhizobiales bacterium GAS188]